VAFIRRVRTASGATAVQIAEYARGGQRVVKHVGSARTEVELGLLLERARRLLEGPAQEALDFGPEHQIERVVRKTPLVRRPADPALFEVGLGAGAATHAHRGPEGVRDRGVRTPRVVSTDSRVLFDALAGVFDDLGFGLVGHQTGGAVFRDLVIARVVEPTSILDTPRVLRDLGRTPASDKTMRRALARCVKGSWRDQIATACFTHASTSGDVSLCLYDVTTLYFEAEKEDDLRKVGYSKERRVDPQIVVGLLVDREGFHLEIGCYEGNQAETATIVPIVKQFQQRHNLAGMVVVADAGMLSASNLRELDEADLRFIVGSRVSKAPTDLGSHFRWHGDAFTNGQTIDTITPKTGHDTSRGGVSGSNVKAEPVWDPQQHTGSWRAVWAYSTKRAVRDNITLTAQENRAKAVVAGEKTARAPRFVKTTNGTKTLDETSLTRARRLVGLKGYVTNIAATVMPADEVISSYHELWHVEQSFRMSKTDLRARPMFVRTRDAIEAHLTISFTALALSREVQTRTGLAIRNVIRQLRPLRSATIAINGATQTLPPDVPREQQAILDAIQTPGTHALSE
jgi:hypothetical protein